MGIRKSVTAAAAIAISLTATSAMAQQPAGEPPLPVVLGIGGQSCSVWLNNKEPGNPTAESLASWITGFMTAINYSGIDPSRNILGEYSLQQLSNQLDLYCTNNPNMQLNTAVLGTVEDLLRLKGYDPRYFGEDRPLPLLPPQQ